MHLTVDRGYQLMETDDPRLPDRWIAAWSNLVEFEVQPGHDNGRGSQDDRSCL